MSSDEPLPSIILNGLYQYPFTYEELKVFNYCVLPELSTQQLKWEQVFVFCFF